MKNAKDAKEPLTNALAELLGMKPEDIDLILIPKGDHIIAQFIVADPDSDVSKMMESDELPIELRKQVVEKRILPNQTCKRSFLL